jgi:hypothetical protein
MSVMHLFGGINRITALSGLASGIAGISDPSEKCTRLIKLGRTHGLTMQLSGFGLHP